MGPQLFFWERPDLIDPPLRPLPRTRPRRLTNAPDTCDQLQSSLIARLPAEVRVIIWEYVVGPEDNSEVLHIECADGIVRHNRCYQAQSKKVGFQHDCWSAAWRKPARAGGALGRGEPEGHRRTMLPLLITCKLMYVPPRLSHYGQLASNTWTSYNEGIDLLYSTHTFDFRRTHSALRLPHVMLRHRMQKIHHITFSTAFACYNPVDDRPGRPADYWELPDDRLQWQAACHVLASLHHLQRLRVTIILICQVEQHQHPTEDLLYDFLQPLTAVRASRFTVEVAKPFQAVCKRLGNTPFQVVERELPVGSHHDPKHICNANRLTAERCLICETNKLLLACPSIEGFEDCGTRYR